MSVADLILWGLTPDAYGPHRSRDPLKVTGGDLGHVLHEAAQRHLQGWRQLVAVPEGAHPRDVATCGACWRSWDAERHPTPAGLCPWCNGDERAAAPHRCYVFGRHP